MKKETSKKNNVSRRMLLSFRGAAVLIIMIVTLLGTVLSIVLGRDISSDAVYVSQAAILALAVLTFYRIADRQIVRKIHLLSAGTIKAASGAYDIRTPAQGNDEFSDLMARFNQMAEELQANAFLSKDFTRYVSHELKTPLCVIHNYAELTQDSTQL